MAAYLKTVEQLRRDVNKFLNDYVPETNDGLDRQNAAIALAHLLNLTVRACPRAVQATVRRNIVGGAVEDHCTVNMTKGFDEQTQREFNKINIGPKR